MDEAIKPTDGRLVQRSASIVPGVSRPGNRIMFIFAWGEEKQDVEIKLGLGEEVVLSLSPLCDLEDPKILTMYKASQELAKQLHAMNEVADIVMCGATDVFLESDIAQEWVNDFLIGYKWIPEDHPQYEQYTNIYNFVKTFATNSPNHNPAPGYVYLVRAVTPDNYYKIGLSKEPKKRLKFLGVKLPFPIEVTHLIKTNDRYRAEKELHEMFAQSRVDGEWFCLNSNQVTHICNIKTMMYGGAA